MKLSFRCVSKETLDSHLISHCAEKLMACEECDFRCRSLYGLDRHYQKEHGQGWTQTYECHACESRFIRGNDLTKHLISAHGFNWPSGHSRFRWLNQFSLLAILFIQISLNYFRYKEDTDGIYRLQTVRYESLEVTQEMMRNSNSSEPALKVDTKADVKYDLKLAADNTDKKPSYVLMISESGEENVVCPTDNNIVITIEDVDAKGNVLKTETTTSNEIICAPDITHFKRKK